MESRAITITKHTIQSYKLRGLPGGAWADINIDEGDHAGRIQIASDYGDWQYYWSACGIPFKEFLIKLHVDYVASKFRCSDEFDCEGTVRMYRRMIIESRRLDEYSAEKARQMWGETETIAQEASTTDSFYYIIKDRCPLIYEGTDYCPDYAPKIADLFMRFWQEAWPIFIQALKEETTVVA